MRHPAPGQKKILPILKKLQTNTVYHKKAVLFFTVFLF